MIFDIFQRKKKICCALFGSDYLRYDSVSVTTSVRAASISRYVLLTISKVQKELEAEKKKSNDESTNMWINKYHKLEERVDRMKKTADKLEQANKHYRE